MSGLSYHFKGVEIGLPLIFGGGFHNLNYSIKLGEHIHEVGPEITYVMKGFAEWQLENGVILAQSGSTLALAPRNVRHLGGKGIIAPCWLFWYLLDLRDPQTARLNTPFTVSEMKRICDVFAERPGMVFPASAKLNSHFVRLLELIRQNSVDVFDAVEMRLLWCRIILDTVKCLEADVATADCSLTTRAREYMKSNIADNISVDDIAAACGLSESQFARRFKQETGITPADCMQRMRVEEACRRLRQTRDSITAIAFALGFSSSQYFSMVFKRYTGATPRNFRKSC